MEIIKKYKWLIFFILVVLAGIFAFYHLYHTDIRELADFSASYEKFEKAISDFSRPFMASNNEGTQATDDFERNADEVLLVLQIKASARLSSLIKNDAELMATTLEIADLSRKELDALKAYRRAVAGKDVQSDKIAKEFVDLRNKRQTAYARFKELAELRD